MCALSHTHTHNECVADGLSFIAVLAKQGYVEQCVRAVDKYHVLSVIHLKALKSKYPVGGFQHNLMP